MECRNTRHIRSGVAPLLLVDEDDDALHLLRVGHDLHLLVGLDHVLLVGLAHLL